MEQPLCILFLNVVNAFHRIDIVTIQNHLALQLVPVLPDVIMFHHDNHHINFIEELVKIQNLVLDNLLAGEEGVKGLERTGQVTILNVEHLEGGALTDVVNVLFIGQTVETHTTIVGDIVFLHNLVDALQNKHGLVVVGLHALIDNLGQLRIVAHKEPRVNADAVPAYAWSGLQDVDTRMHVADTDNLIYIHVVVATNTA